MSTVETHEFQTEARQLLDLMIHSIYSNKDIFLRELISNSSDALDKRRFESLQQPELLPADTELHIFIEADSEARTLSIMDTGIGMSRDEVIALIGTIAKSGTGEFAKALKKAQNNEANIDLIGQFGVGFYSTFMVADRVALLTRRAGEETATRWESSGEGTYTLEEAHRETAGTTVTLHLKPVDEENGMKDYTEEWVLRQIVKQYSDFVSYPIYMNIERRESDYDDEHKAIPGTERTVTERQTLNSMKAIWLRDKSSVTEEEYNEFYKHISHDWTEPMKRIQAKIEGALEYRILFFIPAKAPYNLYHHGATRHGVHLYVKRVFILDDARELLPEYLRFLRGIVDSEDLSLNISREMLQKDRQIERMRKGIVSKVLDALRQMRDQDAEKYKEFWKEFGRTLKEGLLQDHENQERLLELCLFDSTMDSKEQTSLQQYIDRMKPDQDAIYYMTGESRAIVENSPHLEAFNEGYEVLLLTDTIDELWAQPHLAHAGKTFKSVGKGAVELGSEEKKQAEEQRQEKQKEYASLLERLKDALKDEVKEVRLSNRLRESAACLVSEAHDMSPQLEQMMKAMGQEMPKTKRILELNPQHPILNKLQEVFAGDSNSELLGDYAELLYGEALLAEGTLLPNPGRFSKLISEVMVKALG